MGGKCAVIHVGNLCEILSGGLPIILIYDNRKYHNVSLMYNVNEVNITLWYFYFRTG